MISSVFPTGFLYSLAKDGFAAWQRWRRKLSPSDVIALREKWKPIFEQKIWETHQEKLRRDIIVRDVKRLDSYPEAKETKGISPWFRAALVGTYHRGIYVGLRWETLCQHGGDWRLADDAKHEQGDLQALVIGSVRYEDIESVDWDGDEYYYFPHIYCYFSHKTQPYEHVGYYAQIKRGDELPHYTEVASYKSVRKLSQKLGIRP